MNILSLILIVSTVLGVAFIHSCFTDKTLSHMRKLVHIISGMLFLAPALTLLYNYL